METKKMLKKVRSEVGNVLSTVANKAEYVAKLSKLKLDIAQKNAKINNIFKDVGEYVYGNKKEFGKDPFIAEMLKDVDELKQSIEDIKSSIETLKSLHAEKSIPEDKQDSEQDPKE